MNTPPLPHSSAGSPASNQDSAIDLRTLLHLLGESRRLIAGITLACVLLGWLYSVVATPIYESNLLLQVDDSNSASKALFGEAAGAVDTKTAAQSEIEILRSRNVVSRPVDSLQLNLSVQPRRLPVIGGWLARQATGLSTPGLLGMGGYAWGNESIRIGQLQLPDGSGPQKFTLTAGANGQYQLLDTTTRRSHTGQINVPLRFETTQGPATLLVTQLHALPGIRFDIHISSRLSLIESLQNQLQATEIGRQSNIIRVALRGADPLQITRILNAIGDEYVNQNVRRKSEEAEKSLAFLNEQLPSLKTQLDTAETLYNDFRRAKGTVSLDSETQALLAQSVALEEKLQQLGQKRLELLGRYTAEHPSVRALDAQMAELRQQNQQLAQATRQLPDVQQNALRLERDIKVSTTLYTNLLQTTQQLMLARASKVGSVRLIDPAVVPEVPVQPQRTYIMVLSLIIGLALGIAAAVLRRLLHNTVEGPDDIENRTQLPVLASIPHSGEQSQLAQSHANALRVLAHLYPHAPTTEGLRSFMTALQFALPQTPHPLVVVTGPTLGVGKSFVALNFAALLAQSGLRVLLIDADLRRGQLHAALGAPRSNGLSELLAGRITTEKAVRTAVLPGLDFMPSGDIPANPVELLRRPQLAQHLHTLRTAYDLILLDSPPILPVADSAVLSPLADATLLVVREGLSTHMEISESIKRLGHVGVQPLGAVLNDMRVRRHRYGYAYEYGYTPSATPRSSGLLARVWQRLGGGRRKP